MPKSKGETRIYRNAVGYSSIMTALTTFMTTPMDRNAKKKVICTIGTLVSIVAIALKLLTMNTATAEVRTFIYGNCGDMESAVFAGKLAKL